MIASPTLLRISKIPSTGSRQPSSISRSAAVRSGRLATKRSAPLAGMIPLTCNEIAGVAAALISRPAGDARHRLR